ncbi:MAG: phage tail tube protein, partial [Panacagrimonas sp.]
MALQSRLRAILAKIETTYGTDAAPTGAANAVLLRSIKTSPLEQETVDRTLVRPFFGGYEKLPTKGRVTFEIELEAVGFGTAGPASPTAGYDALLRMCGMARTVNAGTSVLYSLASTSLSSGTIYFYQDGTLHKAVGCRGNLAVSFSINEIPVFKLTIWGLYGGVTDVALPSVTLTGYQTPEVCNAINTTALTVHGFTGALLRSLEINLNNTLVHRNLVNSTEEILLTDRVTGGSLQIEATTVAAKDWWTVVRTAALGTFSITHGSAGRRIKLDSTRMQIVAPD